MLKSHAPCRFRYCRQERNEGIRHRREAVGHVWLFASLVASPFEGNSVRHRLVSKPRTTIL